MPFMPSMIGVPRAPFMPGMPIATGMPSMPSFEIAGIPLYSEHPAGYRSLTPQDRYAYFMQIPRYAEIAFAEEHVLVADIPFSSNRDPSYSGPFADILRRRRNLYRTAYHEIGHDILIHSDDYVPLSTENLESDVEEGMWWLVSINYEY